MHEVKNMLGWNHIHLEGCKQWYASKKYCSKDDTRLLGPWTEAAKPLKLKIKGDLLPWQQGLVDYINGEVSERLVRVYHDPVGKKGKSTIGIHLARTRPDILYIPSGKKEGVKEAVIRAVATGRYRAVIFNIPRKMNYVVPWDLMEELKDGCALNTRYEGLLAHFEPVHVIVMTNWLPHESVREDIFTEDRWDIVTL